MKPSILKLLNDERTLKNLAKYMALHCMRNTELENLHAGKVPASATGDFSDVKIVTPEHEIPWTEASRISDPEMKMLMNDAVDQCYAFLSGLFGDPAGDELIEGLSEKDPMPKWDDPPSKECVERDEEMKTQLRKHGHPVRVLWRL